MLAGTSSGKLHAEELRVEGRPARRGDLEDAYVVERALLRVERRVPPEGLQEGIADGVRVRGLLDVDRVADRGLAASVRTDRTPVGDRDVVDPLLRLALGIEPALDDLDAIEVGAVRIADGADEERRGLAGLREIPPMGTPSW